MKKAICACLCLMLLFGACAARASEIQLPLLDTLIQQILMNSSYRGTITAQMEGEAPAFADAAQWALWKSALPSLSLQSAYVRSRAAATLNQSQLTLTLSGASGALTSAMLSGRGDMWVLSGGLLGDERIALSRDVSQLYELFFGAQPGQWPSLWRALAAIMAADDAWQARLDDALLPYEAKLNIWLQAYTAQRVAFDEAGVIHTHTTIDIPLRAVSLQAQQLLLDFYADDELLSLLREKLTVEEAQTYLEPGMQPLFLRALSAAAAVDKTLRIEREYAGTALVMTRQTIALPMLEGSGVESVSIRQEIPAEGGLSLALECAFAPPEGMDEGVRLALTVLGAPIEGDGQPGGDTTVSGHLYTGVLSATFPEMPGESFAVAEGAADAQASAATASLTYNLYVDHGLEAYDASADRRSRSYEATLLLRPENVPGALIARYLPMLTGLSASAAPALDAAAVMHAQSLSLDIDLYAGSSNRTPTHLDAVLTWRDMETDSAIALKLASRTASAIAQTAVSAQGATRVDLLSPDARSAWLTGLLPGLQARAAVLYAAILSAAQSVGD